MSDRRIGDRRQPEEGVIKIKFQDAVWYIILVFILVISITANIVLAINNNRYKKEIDAAYYGEEFYVDVDENTATNENANSAKENQATE